MGGSRTVPTVRRKISGHPQLPPTTKSPAPLCASTHWSIVFIVLVQLSYAIAPRWRANAQVAGIRP